MMCPLNPGIMHQNEGWGRVFYASYLLSYDTVERFKTKKPRRIFYLFYWTQFLKTIQADER